MAAVIVFIGVADNYHLVDNKGKTSTGGDIMKNLLLSLVYKVEEFGEFVPFDLSEPVRNNSHQ
ncbi:hypothetical protein [Peribacillus muralis]|uniref:hypothetical protein n=1 Tax=Peribacillus muralis TaxID=264697 RepID=UPI003D03B268